MPTTQIKRDFAPELLTSLDQSHAWIHRLVDLMAQGVRLPASEINDLSVHLLRAEFLMKKARGER